MITPDREYRSFGFESNTDNMTTEGYAAVYNQRTLLFTDGETEFWEEFIPGCFDGVDLSNVVMNYNHTGKPVARTRNATLKLELDSKGLKHHSYLGGTAEGRNLHEEIKGGYIDKMSICFNLAQECAGFEWIEPGKALRRITKVTDVYDVAAVDMPAYEQTSIYARNSALAEAEKQKALEDAKEKEARQKLRMKLKMKRRKM